MNSLPESFFSRARTVNDKDGCIHPATTAYHVNRHQPAWITVCDVCHHPLKNSPDVVIEQVVERERVKHYRHEVPAEIGTAEWLLFLFILALFMVFGFIIGGMGL